MITTQPLQTLTRFNALICLTPDIEILLPKKLQLLAKDLETHQSLKPIDPIILTPIELYCLCEEEITAGSFQQLKVLSSIIHIVNMFNKYLGSYSLKLSEISYKRESYITVSHRITHVAENLFINNHKESMTSIFGEARFEDMPEWFRNGIWIIQS
jgi:hypothetical protein